MRAELRQALRDGFDKLSEGDQALLRLYALAERYKDVAELLQMKTGSIGPTIGRSLDRLRQTRAVRKYLGTGPAAKKRKGGDQLELAPLERRRAPARAPRRPAAAARGRATHTRPSGGIPLA